MVKNEKLFERNDFKMKRRFLSVLLSMVMLVTLFSSICTVASATTVRDMSGFIVASAVPTDFSINSHTAGTGAVTYTDGSNNSRTFTLSGTSGTGNNYATGTGFYFGLPNLGDYPVNSNANAKPYILHLSYRIQNDRTNPADILHRMQYKNSSNNGSPKDIFYSNTTQLTLNDDNSLNITSANASSYNNLDFYDFKVDIYENLKTGHYQMYINGVKWISAYDYSPVKSLFGSSSNVINNFRMFVKQTGAAYSFNVVNPCFELYSEDVMMDEAIAYSVSGMSNYLNTTASTVKTSVMGNSGNSLSGSTSSYSVSGSGGYAAWWDSEHQISIGSSATADVAWVHIGYNISSGSNISLQMDLQYFYGNSKTRVANGIVPAHSGTSYRADLFYDTSAEKMYIYYDKVYSEELAPWYDSTGYKTKHWRLVNSLSGSYSYTISNIVFETYAKGVTPGDMLIGHDTRSTTNPDYVYQINGIQSGTNVIGKMDGLCNITGDNSSGYKLQPNSVNATNGGFARFYLGYTSDTGIFQRDTDRVLHQTFYYKPSSVSTEQTIGMRGAGPSGSGGYKYFLFANPSTGKFEDADRNAIKPYNTSTWYKVDIIVNNKNFEYYFLLDGVCIEHGTLYWSPIWQTVFTSRSTSDYMHIKNLTTTLYKNNYTLLNKVTPQLTRVYAENTALSVSGSNATVTTSFIGPAGNANTKILYGVYDSAGQLLKYQAVDSASGYINGSSRSDTVSIPSGSTTLKVFMWNVNVGSNILTPLSNSISKSLQ